MRRILDGVKNLIAGDDTFTFVVIVATGVQVAHVLGETGSTSAIAIAGAHQTSLGGGTDAFLVELNSSGVIQDATYYGGTGNENTLGGNCAVDPSATTLYICGNTVSTGGISTAGSHQTSFGGGTNDAFLIKFNGSPCGSCVAGGSGTIWTWTGCVDTDWFDPCNWDRLSVPTTTSNVIIPNTVNKPLITGSYGDCFDITIQSSTGARLDIQSTAGGGLNVVK